MQVFEHHLSTLAGAMMTGDFQTFRSLVCLPFMVVTGVKTTVLRTETDLRIYFETLSWDSTEEPGFSEEYSLTSVSMLDAQLIGGTYRTQKVQDGEHIGPSRSSFVLLRREADGWKSVAITNYDGSSTLGKRLRNPDVAFKEAASEQREEIAI